MSNLSSYPDLFDGLCERTSYGVSILVKVIKGWPQLLTMENQI
jgi:hypothetical protein